MKKNYKKPILIAEIGCNHMGDIKIAKKMILALKNSGVKFVKFQKRNTQQLASSESHYYKRTSLVLCNETDRWYTIDKK